MFRSFRRSVGDHGNRERSVCPSISVADWGCSLTLRPKIKCISLNSHLFKVAFCVLQGVVYFQILFCEFLLSLFKLTNKFITIESNVIYGAVGPPGEHPSSGMAVGGISHNQCCIPDFGHQVDRNSDTKYKTSITCLLVYYMTTNTVHIVNNCVLEQSPKILDHGE